MRYRKDILIRFHHCDPAGIVFYPRYFEMFNELVEDWFADALGLGFDALVARGEGVPTLHAECDFLRASQIGDTLAFELWLTHLGRSSFRVAVRAAAGAEPRLEGRLALAYVRLGPPLKAVPIPDSLRGTMRPWLEPAV